MTEKLLIKFKLPIIENLSLVNIIVALGYRKTGNKFRVAFNGSKGYLSNIEISCEGYQRANNRIFVDALRNKNNTLKKVMVNVFYSEQNGVRLSTGNDSPKIISLLTKETLEQEKTKKEESELPF